MPVAVSAKAGEPAAAVLLDSDEMAGANTENVAVFEPMLPGLITCTLKFAGEINIAAGRLMESVPLSMNWVVNAMPFT